MFTTTNPQKIAKFAAMYPDYNWTRITAIAYDVVHNSDNDDYNYVILYVTTRDDLKEQPVIWFSFAKFQTMFKK